MTRTSSPARIAGAGLAGLVAAGVLLAASPGWTGPPDRGPVYPAAHPTGDASPTGVYKERLSQSALYYGATQVSDAEARDVYDWLLAKGMKFHLGTDEKHGIAKFMELIRKHQLSKVFEPHFVS